MTLDSFLLDEQHDPSARCLEVGRGHGSQLAKPIRHVCAAGCPAPSQTAQAPCGAGVCQYGGKTQTPYGGVGGVPSPQTAAQEPHVPTWFFFDSNDSF